MIRRHIFVGMFMAVAFTTASASMGNAQEKTAADAEAKALAKATQNPVSSMASIPFQFNFTSGGALGSQTVSNTNIQPVLPLTINENWNLVARTIVPFVSIPLPNGERSAGIADIQEQLFFSPVKAGSIIWGIGPQLSLPTATNSLIATGQVALGLSAVVLGMPGNFVVGTLIGNVWRISGNDQGPKINQFTMQPFINLNLARGWAISTGPVITANWSAASGEEWTVPVGMGVSKVDRIGARPVSVALQYYHLAEHPSGSGDDLWRLSFSLLYPRAKAAK